MQQYLLIAFLIALAIQLIYMLTYAIAISTYKLKTSEIAHPVSVIVCAFNELENLKVLIPKLLSQSHEEFEVIIVNDNSTDGSYEYLIEQTQLHDRIKLINIDLTPDHFTRKKYAITLGVKGAKYEHLVFTDADCYPASEDWLSNIAGEYSDRTEFVIGASLYEERKGVLNNLIQFETYWTAIKYLGNAAIGLPYMAVGRSLSYKKSMFLKNRGFSDYQNVIGGDDDLFVNAHAHSKNTRIALGSDALTYSYPKTTWESFFIQKIRHLSVGKKYKTKHKMILSLYTLSSLGFWIVGTSLVVTFPAIIGGGFLLRMLVQFLMYYVASKRIGKTYVPIMLPLLDILFGFYYITTATVALFTKRIRWS